MKPLPLCALLLLPTLARAQGGALSGPTGLLTVPTAQVTVEGEARTGMTRHDSAPPRRGMDNYLFTVGFLPGLELGGRLADFGQGQTNDLSFHAKYSYRFGNDLALAVGGQDIGGEASNFRSRYGASSPLPPATSGGPTCRRARWAASSGGRSRRSPSTPSTTPRRSIRA
jgi:hypothetical protein